MDNNQDILLSGPDKERRVMAILRELHEKAKVYIPNLEITFEPCSGGYVLHLNNMHAACYRPMRYFNHIDTINLTFRESLFQLVVLIVNSKEGN